MADDAGVRIRLLGGFEVTVGDRPVAADAWPHPERYRLQFLGAPLYAAILLLAAVNAVTGGGKTLRQ